MTDIYTCPACGKKNSDNFPVIVAGEMKAGACAACWNGQSQLEWMEYCDNMKLKKEKSYA